MHIITKHHYRLYLIAKRWRDIVIASIAVVLLTPIIVGIGVAVKLESQGPAVVEEERVGTRVRGKGGQKSWELQQITLLRFRTTSKSGTQLTQVGKFLQRTRLDNLPQLLNVIKGDLSLVGPYPPHEDEIQTHMLSDVQSLQVKPGLIKWPRLQAPMNADAENKVELDP